MRFRKPEIIPTLFITIATIVLLSLGFWQIERLKWKENELAHIKKAQSEDALGNLAEDLTGVEYHTVLLTGTFLNDKMFHLVGKPQGEGAGFYVITPLKLDDDGRIILVNRGFAPVGTEGAPENLQTVRGIIRPNRPHRMFMPNNLPEKNVWFYEDIEEMSKIVGEPVLPLLVEATGESKKGEYPAPSNGKITLRNDHLNYAITWFLLSIIGLIMFAAYHRIPEEKHK